MLNVYYDGEPMSQRNDTNHTAEQHPDSDCTGTQADSETDKQRETIQTKTGEHRISEDNPVRLGHFGCIDTYHTTNCRYVSDTDQQNIWPLTEQDLRYHEELEECTTCKTNRTDAEPNKSPGDRTWFNKATDPDYT